ncbi:hypothetical protein [Methylocystis parvus]|uniref:Uncharacterized protein n=1 Tax=Methylocystis parvus TaxID=134 RepID=A0A6B8MBI0_9HYPH|nr:hypothetical protein [Methylocystis parvus]QGN00092.1 hypothetical protein F7D14_21145 [Methylocystis parvus]WBK02411.1 hypothetical protein MMG94_21495 [Methylocystis parvus OBBP]
MSNRLKRLLICLLMTASPAYAASSSVTVDQSGIVVAGAWGGRRAYAPLDVSRILPGFLGAWAVRPEICVEGPRSAPFPDQTPNGFVGIAADRISTKSGTFVVAGAYVRTPETMTPWDIESALAEKRKIVLSLNKERNAAEMLVELRPLRQGESHFYQLILSDEKKTLLLEEAGRERVTLKLCE